MAGEDRRSGWLAGVLTSAHSTAWYPGSSKSLHPLLLGWWETEAQRGTEMHLKPQWPGSGHPQGPWTQPLPGSTGQGALAC